MSSPSFPRRAVVSIAVFLVLLLCAFLYLFREDRAEVEGLGSARMEYRWGKPHLLKIDRNRDGRVDYRALMQGTGWHAAPLQVWVDEDHDGFFEMNVVLSGGAAQSVRRDSDKDGTYESEITGVLARREYDAWQNRWALKRLSGEDRQLYLWERMGALISNAGSEGGLRFIIDGMRVTTHGMASVLYPEMTTVAPSAAHIDEAKRLLVDAADWSFKREAPLSPGEEHSIGGHTVEVRESHGGQIELVTRVPVPGETNSPE